MGTVARHLRWLALTATLLLAGCPKPPAPDTGALPPGTGGSGTVAGIPEPPTAAESAKNTYGAEEGIVLGGYMSLTGNISTYGQSSTKAMGMAVEEINAAGGVLGGQMLRLVMEDTASKPDESATAAQRLIEVHQAVVVVGEVASSNSLAAAPICQQKQIPMVTPSSTNPQVTQKGDYIFRTCYTDDLQGSYVGAYAAGALNLRRAAILKDNDSDYSKGLSEAIQSTFTRLGGEIVAVEAYTQGEKDFSAVLTKLNDLELDCVFIPGYYEDVGQIIKQGRDLGLDLTFVGGDGWDSPKLAEIAGDYLDDRCYFVNHYSKNEERPQAGEFAEKFRQRYGEYPDALAACAYDAIYIVADAINRAGAVDSAKIRDALAETTDFEGATGVITIDSNRNATKPCVVLGFEHQEQVIRATYTPDDLA